MSFTGARTPSSAVVDGRRSPCLGRRRDGHHTCGFLATSCGRGRPQWWRRAVCRVVSAAATNTTPTTSSPPHADEGVRAPVNDTTSSPYASAAAQTA